MTHRNLLCIAAALATLLACCGAPPPPSPAPSDAAFTVEFRRSGGFAGVDDRLVVTADGMAHRTTRRGTCDLPIGQAELDALRQELDRAGVASLPSATPVDAVADAFEYDLTYRGTRRHYSQDQVPPRLQPALNRLNALTDRRCPA